MTDLTFDDVADELLEASLLPLLAWAAAVAVCRWWWDAGLALLEP